MLLRRSDDELADAVCGCRTTGVLEPEPFADVLVADEQNVGATLVKGGEGLLDLGDGAAHVAEVRPVEGGQCPHGVVGGQVSLGPPHLRRAGEQAEQPPTPGWALPVERHKRLSLGLLKLRWRSPA
jgi:hypothetical protein